MTQTQTILKHLRKGGKLTPMKAFKMFDCLSLSQRIGEISRDGTRIKKAWKKLKNGKKVREYSLS